MNDEEKIELILHWAADYNTDFDTNFVEDLQRKVNNGYELSDGQSNALDNIIKKFRIEEEVMG